VHGANRLGSNSLVDLVVFGRAASQRAGETVRPNERLAPFKNGAAEAHLARFDRLRYAKGDTPTAKLRAEMQMAMQEDAAVFRTGESLKSGAARLAEVHARRADLAVTDRSLVWNTDLMETLEFENLAAQAMVTLQGALNRTESRGAHAREDFPERDDTNWLKHTLAWFDDETGRVTIDYRPVHMNTLTNEVQSFPPKTRVY
jgi:succinate dehydrogenase / fumarate reductase flavoprotein subunit